MSIQTPVTVSIHRTVKSGSEAAFERALHAFVERSLLLPGQLGVHVMRPAPGSGSREYAIVRKFADRESLRAFRSSTLYQEWRAMVPDLTEGDPRFEELCGLESWFTLPGEPLRPLPRWKTALVTYIGVYPVATLLSLTLGPVISSWHFLLAHLLFNACMVVLLTWVVMPTLTRSLQRWLYPDAGVTAHANN